MIRELSSNQYVDMERRIFIEDDGANTTITFIKDGAADTTKTVTGKLAKEVAQSLGFSNG